MFRIIGTKRLAELEAQASDRLDTLSRRVSKTQAELDVARDDAILLSAKLDTLSRRLARTEAERDEALAKIQRMTGNLRRGSAKTAQHTNGG